MKYLGPYGFVLLTAFVLYTAFYILSWKLYPDVHITVFKTLWELAKTDFRFSFVFVDIFLFYLGIFLLLFGLLIGGYKLAKGLREKLIQLKRKKRREEEILTQLKSLVPLDGELIQRHKDLFVKVWELMGSAPASKRHHHSERYGLLKHSLETVQKLLERKREIAEILGVDLTTAEKVAVLLGLFHDVGKLYDGVSFKYQNALAGYEMGRLGIEFPPKLLARIIYAITVEHSEFAKLETDPLVRFLVSADTESVKEEKVSKLETCFQNLVSNLLKHLEELRSTWNDRRFFKVVVNPAKGELLVNFNVVKEVYNLLECRFPLLAILEEGIKRGFVKPVEGEPYGRFKVGNIGTFPAVLFNLDKFPFDVEGIEKVPDYIVDRYEEFRNRFLDVLSEILEQLDVNDISSPVVFYRDSKGREWYLVKASLVDTLKEKGLAVSSLKELSSLTGFQIKQVKKINTKALMVPKDLLVSAVKG